MSVYTPSETPVLGPVVPLSALPPQDWKKLARDLQRDGVILVKKALTPEGIKAVEAACEHAFAHPSPSANNLFYEKNSGEVFFEDKTNWMSPVARKAGIDTMVRALWGMDDKADLRYMYEQLFKKEGPKPIRRTPWHQVGWLSRACEAKEETREPRGLSSSL
jgi:hypothetical protein